MESLQEIVLCDIKSEIHRFYDTENIQFMTRKTYNIIVKKNQMNV